MIETDKIVCVGLVATLLFAVYCGNTDLQQTIAIGLVGYIGGKTTKGGSI